jgi:colicin import membrane protein
MTSDTVPYSVPRPPGRGASIALAILMHAALFGFLWFGINWVSQKPETMDAEVWSAQDLEKAPPPPPQVEENTPPPKETPVEKAPEQDPDIALEEIKKKQRLEQEKHDRDEAEAAKKKQQEIDENKRLEAQKKIDEDKKKALAEVKKQQELDDRKRAKFLDDEKKRIAGETSSTSTAGTSSKSQGSQGNAGWIARVTAKVKSNIVGVSIPPDANDPAEFVVGLLPDGSVAGIRQTRKSGVPAFDDAVRRAIEASQPYPPDSSGRVPPSFVSTNRPRDQQP